MKNVTRLSALSILAFLSEPTLAETEEWLDSRASDGIAMGCSNPEQILQLKRSTTSTEILQIGRSGVTWQAALPPIRDKNGSYYFSNRGDAAVVVTSLRDGEAFLVSPDAGKVPIDAAFVQEVHFEKDRALVVTSVLDGAHELRSKRVRIYEIGSGELLFDQHVDDVSSDDTRPLERQWYVKPTVDGRAFYLVRSTGAHAGSIGLTDIATSNVQSIPLRGPDHEEVEVIDALFPTQESGFVAAGIDGVFVADRSGLRSMAAPKEIGSVEHLHFSPQLRQLAAVGMDGWAIYDLAQRRWSTVEIVGYALKVRAALDGWSVMDRSSRKELRIFDTKSGTPTLSRAINYAAGGSVVCYNSQGIMQNLDSSFHWQSVGTSTP